MAAQASPHSARWSTSSRTPGWELPSPKLSHSAKQFWRSGWRACELSSPGPVGGTSDASKTQSGLNVNHFRPRCMKARPDTLISPYYSNRRCLAHSSRLNPHEYLTDVPARLPSTKITGIHELLPAHWKPSRQTPPEIPPRMTTERNQVLQTPPTPRCQQRLD